jgi:hypothetical protein
MPMPGPRRTALLIALIATGCTPIGITEVPDATPRPPPTPSATAIPSEAASSSDPSPRPTSATPTPDPNAPELLELEVTGCPGGVVVDWSPTTHADFHHYLALRSIVPEVETAYPPIAPAVDWGHSYSTDRFITSAVDITVIPSDTVLYYRVMGYDVADRVLAASAAQATSPFEVVELDPIQATPAAEPGTTLIDWGLFGGLGDCFSAYHIRIGPAGTTPSTTLTVISDQSISELQTAGLHAGQSYAIVVEAVRSTTLGSFVVGRTQVATYTVP